jgi:hypothetical protein
MRGIAAVLQGRLVEANQEFAITEKARERWRAIDVAMTGTMLVRKRARERDPIPPSHGSWVDQRPDSGEGAGRDAAWVLPF